MSETPGGATLSLVAELWYLDAPDLDAPEVLEALRTVSPGRRPRTARSPSRTLWATPSCRPW